MIVHLYYLPILLWIMSILFGESMKRHPESQNHGGNREIGENSANCRGMARNFTNFISN